VALAGTRTAAVARETSAAFALLADTTASDRAEESGRRGAGVPRALAHASVQRQQNNVRFQLSTVLLISFQG